jgi:hypothetical protein
LLGCFNKFCASSGSKMAGNFFLVIFANILHIIHIKRSI